MYLKQNQNAPVYSNTYRKSMDQPGKVASPARGQLNRKKLIFPCPRSCLRIWSRETGSAVPSRVSLLISIHTQAKSGAYTYGFLTISAVASICLFKTAIRHRVSPKFIRSRNCVPIAFPAESPPAQGQ